jgi:imidazole glycerol-phosphate synthase subunit HisF
MFEKRPRIIPVLLLDGKGLVKTRKFRDPTYLGDPVNTVRIFNEMEVDEIIILDIKATPSGVPPQFDLLREIAAEALFPLAYGGGISKIADAVRIIESGFERIVVNSACVNEYESVKKMCRDLGSSSIVGSMDVNKHWLHGNVVRISSGKEVVKTTVENWACRLEDIGVGEIMVNVIDRDGEMCGYDLDLISRISKAVSIPVIACGGAASFADFDTALQAGASAAAAGAVFVFKGKHRGVLIQYPLPSDRKEIK